MKHWLTIAAAAVGAFLVLQGPGTRVREASAFGGSDPVSCPYVIGDIVATGDWWYGDGFDADSGLGTQHLWTWCEQPGWLGNLADIYGMEEEFWDQGFGWTDACNPTKPFARLAHARLALEVSSPTPQLSGALSDGTPENPLINWGLLYSARVIDDLRGGCGLDSPFDAVRNGDRVTLHVGTGTATGKGYFYGQNVPERAATLLHEAAHIASAPSHVSKGTQDLNWGMNPAGAYQWTVVWLWQYCRNGINQPPGMACAACDLAQAYLNGSFCVPDATGACTNNTGITVVDRADPADPCFIPPPSP